MHHPTHIAAAIAIAMIHKDTTRAKALALALEGQGLDGEKMEERWNRTQVDLKRGVLS